MWTLELFEKTGLMDLLDGSTTYTKQEILQHAKRECAPLAAIEILEELEDDDVYEEVTDVWPDIPSNDEDFGYIPD